MQTVEQIASLPETKARQCCFFYRIGHYIGPVVFRLRQWIRLLLRFVDSDFFFQVGYVVYQKNVFHFFPSLLYQENVGLKVEWYQGSHWTMFLWWLNPRAHANPPKTMIWGFGNLTRVHVPFISWISESSWNRFRPTFWIRNPIVKSWKASVYMHQCWLSNKHLLTHLKGANGMALHCVLNEDFGSWLYFFLWEALI